MFLSRYEKRIIGKEAEESGFIRPVFVNEALSILLKDKSIVKLYIPWAPFDNHWQ